MGVGERKGHCSALQYIIMQTIIGRVLLFCRRRRSSYIRAAAATRREYGLCRHVVIARRIQYHIFIFLLLLRLYNNNMYNILLYYYIYDDVIIIATCCVPPQCSCRPEDVLPKFSRRATAPPAIESSSIVLPTILLVNIYTEFSLVDYRGINSLHLAVFEKQF